MLIVLASPLSSSSPTSRLPPLDKAKVSNCRVIVHCLAGISRSATIAIAYIMKTMGLSSDDAYRYAGSSPLATCRVKVSAAVKGSAAGNARRPASSSSTCREK